MDHSVRGVFSVLRGRSISESARTLTGFCRSMHEGMDSVSGLRNGRSVVGALCRGFFGKTFPLAMRGLNVICAPVRYISFVVHSMGSILGSRFSYALSSRGIGVLSPFINANAFVAHLVRDNLVGPRSLRHGCERRVFYGRVILLTCCVTSIGVRDIFRRLARQGRCISCSKVYLASAFRVSRRRRNGLSDS